MNHLVFGSVFILSIDSRYDTQVECSGGNVKGCIWRSAFLRFSWPVFDIFDDRRIILEPFLYLFLHTISRNWFSSGEVSWRYFHFITIHFDFSEWKTSFFVFAFELRYFWCFWFIFILVNFGIAKNIYMYRSDYRVSEVIMKLPEVICDLPQGIMKRIVIAVTFFVIIFWQRFSCQHFQIWFFFLTHCFLRFCFLLKKSLHIHFYL